MSTLSGLLLVLGCLGLGMWFDKIGWPDTLARFLDRIEHL